ncbi:MAG: ATP-binding cassette domain-containing protein [Alphaproteobacteria bacterium]
MSAPPLVLDTLRIALAGTPLVELDVTVPPGEVLTVMGPSGSGKSTLLAALVGLLDPAFELTGRIRLGAEDVTALPPERRRIGVLFQDPLLFPHLSVAGNLLFGLPSGGDRRTRRRRVEAALADAGLAGFAPRDPATLSGGQQARVALLRVLLSEPRALLLDEPFAKLDAALKDDIRRFVFARVRERGLATILVTHDPADAAAAGGPVHALAAHG